MIPAALKNKIEKVLSGIFGNTVQITNSIPLAGGCINEALCILSGKEKFFLKFNNAKRYPGMFESEAKGLRVLRNSGSIFIPKVIACGEEDGKSFLILEYMDTGKRRPDFFSDFGISLARLHQNTHELFGLDHANYIGSLIQSNKQHSCWTEFYIEERIFPQIRLANFSGQRIKKFEYLFKKLEEIFPTELPALLHGDLWSGNYLVSATGTVCLFDPSVYYGNREMDIAMTKLFGGFDADFYDAYQNEFSLEPGWRERTDICNLYPLLVHVNLFGGGYINQVDSIINRF